MKNEFDEKYYESGKSSGKSLYTNYKWLPELTIPLAFRLIEELNIKPYHRVLDFGCAKGFLVKALRLLYRDAYGVDISKYAINKCDESVREYVKEINTAADIDDVWFDFIIAKDVLEHIPHQELLTLLPMFREISNCVFVVVPLGDGNKYIIDSYESDITHIIREDADWWINLFKKCGYSDIHFRYEVDGIKDNYKKFKKGNGFFILK